MGLTAADRRWMDDIVQTVEESWGVVRTQLCPGCMAKLTNRKTGQGQRELVLKRKRLPAHGRFRGSDDDLRQRFEEYICAALSAIKFTDFLLKGQASDLTIVGVC